MLNYYKANYPKAPFKDEKTYPPVKCPVLMFHGLDDPFLLARRLSNDTWKWVEKGSYVEVRIRRRGAGTSRC